MADTRNNVYILDSNKMKNVLFFLVVIQFGSWIGNAQVQDSLRVELDIHTFLYRVRIDFGDESSEYDLDDVSVLVSGLSPRRVAVFVTDDSGRAVPVHSTDGGYTSYNSSSELLSKTHFRRIPENRVYVSQWFRLEDLLRGLQLVSGVGIDKWAGVRIRFSVQVRGQQERIVTGTSSLAALSPEKRRELVARYESEPRARYEQVKSVNSARQP